MGNKKVGRPAKFDMRNYEDVYCKCGRKMKSAVSKKQGRCGTCDRHLQNHRRFMRELENLHKLERKTKRRNMKYNINEQKLYMTESEIAEIVNCQNSICGINCNKCKGEI